MAENLVRRDVVLEQGWQAKMTRVATELAESSGAMVVASSGAPRRCKRSIECHVMRILAFALTLSLADFSAASAQTATPDSENGRYSFYPVADGMLRLDTRTGQISQCSRSDAGWACKVVPDERSALETEIARLQGENATLKKELLARGLPLPGTPGPPVAKPDEPEIKLPSDADVDKVISFLERVWRRLVEMGKSVQKDFERKN
jgi:hypothetical protein